MKKVLAVSIFAIMAVGAARADIASTDYVTGAVNKAVESKAEKTYVDTELGKKQDKLTQGANITISATNEISANLSEYAKSSDVADQIASAVDGLAKSSEVADAYQEKSTANYQMGKAGGGWQAMTTDQQNALNSGIKAADVTQITTNKTNIEELTTQMGTKADSSALNNYLTTAAAESKYETIEGAAGKYQPKGNYQAAGDYVTNEQLTAKGYQNATQVEEAITGKGYQTSAQVESAITGKGYQTASDVTTTITNSLKDYTNTTDMNAAIKTATDGKEDKSNKVQSISASSTETEYPSAKAVYSVTNSLSGKIDELETKAGTVDTSIAGINSALEGKQEKNTAVKFNGTTSVGDGTHALTVDASGNISQHATELATKTAVDAKYNTTDTTVTAGGTYVVTGNTVGKNLDALDKATKAAKDQADQGVADAAAAKAQADKGVEDAAAAQKAADDAQSAADKAQGDVNSLKTTVEGKADASALGDYVAKADANVTAQQGGNAGAGVVTAVTQTNGKIAVTKSTVGTNDIADSAVTSAKIGGTIELSKIALPTSVNATDGLGVLVWTGSEWALEKIERTFGSN